MTYYIYVENNILNGCGLCNILNDEIENIEVDETLYNDYLQNPLKYIYQDEEIVLNPHYEEELVRKERERLDALNLTRGDVFAALIQARMIDEGTLKAQLELMPETTDAEKMRKMLAINSLSNALNFHRGHDLVNIIGEQLGITPENIDLFFETNDYHYLQEQPEPVEE